MFGMLWGGFDVLIGAIFGYLFGTRSGGFGNYVASCLDSLGAVWGGSTCYKQISNLQDLLFAIISSHCLI